MRFGLGMWSVGDSDWGRTATLRCLAIIFVAVSLEVMLLTPLRLLACLLACLPVSRSGA
jgi:hypothetical protein